MAVTTAHSGRHSRCVVFKRGTSGQPAGETKLLLNERPNAHSIGTTISLARTMFRRLRAAASIVRGSEFNR